jgi:hypothetical protein
METFATFNDLTPWGRVLIEKVIVAQLVSKYPSFKKPEVITVFIRGC